MTLAWRNSWSVQNFKTRIVPSRMQPLSRSCVKRCLRFQWTLQIINKLCRWCLKPFMRPPKAWRRRWENALLSKPALVVPSSLSRVMASHWSSLQKMLCEATQSRPIHSFWWKEWKPKCMLNWIVFQGDWSWCFEDWNVIKQINLYCIVVKRVFSLDIFPNNNSAIIN